MTQVTDKQRDGDNVTPFNVGKLRHILGQPHHRTDDRTLNIVIHSPGHVGGTPSVTVDKAFMGFDWDNNKMLLYPTTPLTALSPEQVEAISQSVKESQSWHAFEQYKKYREKIAALTSQLAAQQQCLKDLLSQDTLSGEQRAAIQLVLDNGHQTDKN